MKVKIAKVLLSLLSLASIIGVLILNHFGTTRMGMIRWLNSYNRGIESSMPLDFFKLALALISVALFAVSMILLFKNKNKKHASTYVTIFATAVSLFCLFYTMLGTSTKTFKIHYFAILLFAMSTVFLSISIILSAKSDD